jgi:electron-transferring-flavoprotein dehydrogenase
LRREDARLAELLGETPIAVVEKGKYPGAHLLSGAVVNPVSLRRLFSGVADNDFPFSEPVRGESIYVLTAGGSFKIPTPPTMKNHGNFTASLSRLGRWMAEKAEELGVMVLSETTALKLIVEERAVRGVRTGDKGIDRNGKPLPNFEPGVDIAAKVTVLGEGTQGHLAQVLTDHFALRRPNPQIYALGVKEIWEVPGRLDRVIHTMGWPLRAGKKYREFGGSFIYPMGEGKVSIGLVAGLDYADASLSIHDLFQEFKTHRLARDILKGGKRNEQGWGAKTIPEGGFYSLPERLHVPGAVLVGDSAGFVNVPSLKGIHYAMESGMLAAESIAGLLLAGEDPGRGDALAAYDRAVRESFIRNDLHKVRNMRQAFAHGFYMGGLLAGLMTVTGGLFPGWRFDSHADAETPVFIGERKYPKMDNAYLFDKLASVYASGNRSRDNQPDHLRITPAVPEAVGEAWISMCPAQVYEWKVDESGKKTIITNPTNCVQCGAITAKGGRLTPPEGGSGPEYKET